MPQAPTPTPDSPGADVDPGIDATDDTVVDGGARPAGAPGRSAVLRRLHHPRDPGDVGDPATRAAQARQTNAHRAAYAAEALHHHGQASHSRADDIEAALVELLTDLHHLCDTCDLELTTLLQAAALIHADETRPR